MKRPPVSTTRGSGIRADIAVVGGGLIGCTIAHALARDGYAVTLHERDSEPGQRASSAAAGMLAPQMEGARHGIAFAAEPVAERAMLALALESRRRWAGFLATLEDESGRRIPYHDEGTLVVALDQIGATALADAAEWQRAEGLSAELLGAEEARRIELAVGPAILAALHLPDDHAVDSAAATRAALEAAAARGVTIETGATVEAIEVAGGRVAGVRVRGEARPAHTVVVAAGAWSGRIEGLPRPLPVRPVRGQMGAVSPPVPPRLVVAGPGAYCVPREDGQVLVGATMEEVGFEDGVSGRVVQGLVDAAARFLPGLAEGGPPDAWSGLRPATPDGLPILGADPDVEGLFYATGHFRNGILLAPVTAATIAALVDGAEPPVEIEAFRPDRFDA